MHVLKRLAILNGVVTFDFSKKERMAVESGSLQQQPQVTIHPHRRGELSQLAATLYDVGTINP
jgi:hypothetical protein